MNITEFNNEKLTALFSEKAHGSMRMHGHEAFDQQARAFRHAFLWANQIDPKSVVSGGLVHGNRVEVVSDPKKANVFIENVDGLITGDKNVFLSVTAADCFPLYLYDPVKEVIALAHSGWKGTLAAVVPHTIERMVEEFNCSPPDIEAYIGPGIQKCHFEVGRDIAQKFPQQFVEQRVVQLPLSAAIQAKEADTTSDTHERVKNYYVDLPAVIDWQLKARGITKIACDTMCTFCNKGIATLNAPPEKSEIAYRWFSFRREKSDPLRTQMAVFGLRP